MKREEQSEQLQQRSRLLLLGWRPGSARGRVRPSRPLSVFRRVHPSKWPRPMLLRVVSVALRMVHGRRCGGCPPAVVHRAVDAAKHVAESA